MLHGTRDAPYSELPVTDPHSKLAIVKKAHEDKKKMQTKNYKPRKKIFMSSKHNPSSEITNLSETNLTIPKKTIGIAKKNPKLL